MQAITCKNLSFTYPNNTENTLSEISCAVEKESLALLCGSTGSGKTTFLKSLKREIAPHGNYSGDVKLFEQEQSKINPFDIGYVSQSPENQLVMENVWQELAFGLENMGLGHNVIQRRIAETVSFFGIEALLKRKTHQLSGGQMQTVNLAAIMVMQPKLLLLDEPTAQLDPIATKDFLQMVKRIHRELGTTIIISEHNLEETLHMADQVLYMKEGGMKQLKTNEFSSWIIKEDPGFAYAMPAAAKIAYTLGEKRNFPLTVGEGKSWLNKYAGIAIIKIKDKAKGGANTQKTILDGKNLWYRYSKAAPFVIENLNLKIENNEIHAVVGGNGSGKSTLLHLLCGAYKPQRGKVKIDKQVKIGLLTQNPKAMFVSDTVLEELALLKHEFFYSDENISGIIERLSLNEQKHRHPYDLSGGEMQKAALAKLLLLNPQILLLDEPSKGLDAAAKQELKNILAEEKKNGKTVIIVTHDLEFAASVSDRCTMLQAGRDICTEQTTSFFKENLFYTTSSNRMMRDINPSCILPEDVMPNE